MRNRWRAQWLGIAGCFAALVGAVAESVAAPATLDPAALVRRTTLIVHDIDASIRFYRDVLGFEVWLENRSVVREDSLPSAAPLGAPSRFAIMKGRHPWVGMIGLLQYGEARSLPPLPRKLVPGDAVLMIETSQLNAIHERMQRAGTPIHKAPVTSEVRGAGGARWNATFLFAWDPDGHMLEINQRGPVLPAGMEKPAAAVARVTREFAPMRYGQLHLRRAAPIAPSGLRTPIVLLHQTPLSGRMFSELLPVLGRDRVVYAPDTPGYGESDGPPRIISLGDYVDALHDVIGELKEPVDLVGYHTGALLASEYAARYPQDVRRLVLISMPLFSAARRRTLTTTTTLATDGSHLLREWRSTMSVRPPGQTTEQAARIVAEKQRAGARAGWAMAAVAAYEPEPRLQLIRAPTTVIRPKDGLWDASADAAQLIPGARLVDAPQWGFGFFDADPAGVATELTRALN
jgi:pimeloyl-ACP methyl ester carboxylesterase/catechol 2,3-dioxygenase-like lactoylglutathione lyase family enzyme